MTLLEGIAAKIDELSMPEPNSGCILWLGNIVHGYGIIAINGKNARAHRIAYELSHGPIPAGLVLDHLCRVRCCVNPNHLEPVTNRENVLRGVGPCAVNAQKSCCNRGHLLSGENLYVAKVNGAEQRICRACKRIVDRKRRRTFRMGAAMCVICGATFMRETRIILIRAAKGIPPVCSNHCKAIHLNNRKREKQRSMVAP